MMIRKVIVYIIITSSLLLSLQPALARQSYNFGSEGTGTTWRQLWDKSYEKAIPQTATLTTLTTIINARQTFFVKNVAEVAATVGGKNAVAKSIQEGLQYAAKEELAKVVEKGVAEKIAKKISVKFGGAFVPGLNIALAVETVFEVVWPADVNWQARGYPLMCVNSATDRFPSCYAYFIPKPTSVGIWWKALDPDRDTFIGDVTKYFFDVPLDVTFLLDLAFGRPEPKCSMAEVKDPSSSDYRPVATADSKVYTNLQPGEHWFTVSCFTAGEQSLIKKIVQTSLNTSVTVIKVVVEGVTGGVKSLWGWVTGQDVIAQSADNYPTLSGLMNGTYIPQWPIPEDVAHQASVVMAVNNPSLKLQVPTLSFSADPMIVTPTRSSILSWLSANATKCIASGGWSGDKSLAGTEAVTPLADTIYTLNCTGPGGSINRYVSIRVAQPGQRLPYVDIKVQ